MDLGDLWVVNAVASGIRIMCIDERYSYLY